MKSIFINNNLGNAYIPVNDTDLEFEVDFTCDLFDDQEECEEDRWTNHPITAQS